MPVLPPIAGGVVSPRQVSLDVTETQISPRLLGSQYAKRTRRSRTLERPKKHDESSLRLNLLDEAEDGLNGQKKFKPSKSLSPMSRTFHGSASRTPRDTPRERRVKFSPHDLLKNSSGSSALPPIDVPDWVNAADEARKQLGTAQARRTFQAERDKVLFHRRLHEAEGFLEANDLPPEAISSSSPAGSSAPNLKALGGFHKAHERSFMSMPYLKKWLLLASTDDKSLSESQADGVRKLQIAGDRCQDFTVEMLCKHFQARIAQLHTLDLGENVLTDKAVWALSGALSTSLYYLNLRHNKLGAGTCDAIISFWKMINSGPMQGLKTLDLSSNSLGDAAVVQLCEGICSHATGLKELGLAETHIGKSHKTGLAFRKLLGKHTSLSTLDVHFNYFHGQGAYDLFHGVYDNHMHGNLNRLDISWNQLALAGAWRIAALLATVFRDGETLMHLDLSYNKLQAEEMSVIGASLEGNSSLWGIHLIGNAAAVDGDGYIVPMRGWVPRLNENDKIGKVAAVALNQKSEGENVTVTSQMGSTQPPTGDKNKTNLFWAQRHTLTHSLGKHSEKGVDEFDLVHMESAASIESPRQGMSSALPSDTLDIPTGQALKPAETIQWLAEVCQNIPPTFTSVKGVALGVPKTGTFSHSNRAMRAFQNSSRSPTFGCCWICEAWVEVELRWTPGLSGARLGDEVKQVAAYLSFDNFANPIRLEFDADTYDWVGHKMLPPSTVPLALIWQINEEVKTAQNLLTKSLNAPITVNACAFDTMKAGTPVSRKEVNILILAEWATRNRKMGEEGEMANPGRLITVTEDPKEQSRLVVVPRNGKRKTTTVKKEKPPWTFASSVWAPQYPETDELLDRCFWKDWALLTEKMEKVFKINPEMSETLQQAIRINYKFLYTLYRRYSWMGVGLDRHTDDKWSAQNAINIRLNEWTELCHIAFPDGMKRADTDSIFFNCQFVPSQMAQNNGMEERKRMGINRYQWIEGVLRLAQSKYCRGPTWVGIEQGFYRIMENLQPVAEALIEEVSAKRKELFTERCDNALRQSLSFLRTIFEHYRFRYHEACTDNMGMQVTSWMDACRDGDVFDDVWGPKEGGIVFGRSLIAYPDEYTANNPKLYEMGFKEFLISVGMMARRREGYIPGMLSESIVEFISDKLKPLYNQIQTWKGNPVSEHLPGFDLPTEWLHKLSKVLKHLYHMADDDLSGTLTKREFVTAFSSKYFKEKAEECDLDLDFSNQHFLKDLFERLDADGSGEITFVESLNGLAKWKETLKNDERVIAVLRAVFDCGDKDHGGSLTEEEFNSVLMSAQIQKTIKRNGIMFGNSEVGTLFKQLDLDKNGELNLDEMIDGFMKLRKEDMQGDRAIGFLTQVFKEADKNGSGHLSKYEFYATFKKSFTMERLYRLGFAESGEPFTEDALVNFFQQLDSDDDGKLSLQEIIKGFQSMREMFRMRTLEEEQKKWDDREALENNEKLNRKVRSLRNAISIHNLASCDGKLSVGGI